MQPLFFQSNSKLGPSSVVLRRTMRLSGTLLVAGEADKRTRSTPSTCDSPADLHSPSLLFHIYQRCVKPPAANCFHITERQGDLGGFPRPPTHRDTGKAGWVEGGGGLCAHPQKQNRHLCSAYVSGKGEARRAGETLCSGRLTL